MSKDAESIPNRSVSKAAVVSASNVDETQMEPGTWLPTISVITACFNSERTVSQTIASINEQTYPNVEHVFVDGASTDRTLSIIERESLRPKRMISEPDQGIYDALNKGLALSTGDIIGFLHADDFYAHSGVLHEIAARLKEKGVSAVYGDLQYVGVDNVNKVIRHWQTRRFTKTRLKLGWMPPHPTFYVHRSWYDRIGGFDTNYGIAADYLTVLQLFSSADFNAQYIPHVLVKMRMGGVSNRSLTNILRKSREDLDALRQSGVGGYGTLAAKNLRKLGQFF